MPKRFLRILPDNRYGLSRSYVVTWAPIFFARNTVEVFLDDAATVDNARTWGDYGRIGVLLAFGANGCSTVNPTDQTQPIVYRK